MARYSVAARLCVVEFQQAADERGELLTGHIRRRLPRRVVEGDRVDLQRATHEAQQPFLASIDVPVGVGNRHEIGDQQPGEIGTIDPGDDRPQEGLEPGGLLQQPCQHAGELLLLAFVEAALGDERVQLLDLILVHVPVSRSHARKQVQPERDDLQRVCSMGLAMIVVQVLSHAGIIHVRPDAAPASPRSGR